MSLMLHRLGLLRPTLGSPSDTVPDAFEVEDWSIAPGDEKADVTIHALPADHGATITDVEYRLDGGSWASSGGTSSFAISGLTNAQEYYVELRAMNAVGAGAEGDTKQVTPEEVAETFQQAVIALLGAKLRAFWLYDDPVYLWQDTSGTTPVASDTDPVGRVDDLSGNGRHLIQATSDSRPAYRTAGYTQYDGVNDYLSIASPGFTINSIELFQVFEQHAAATANQGLYSFAPASGHDWDTASGFINELGNNSQHFVLFANNSGGNVSNSINASESGLGNTPKALYEISINSGTAAIGKNGALIASDTAYALNETHTGNFYDGARFISSAVSGWAPIRRWATVMTAPLTTDERADLRDLINARYSLW